MSTIRSYVTITRPVNCLMMGFAVIVGSALASSNLLSFIWPNLVLGFITGSALTAASMAINDYYDREIDATNEPSRPIPSGLIKPREALAFAFILTVIGFATAFLISIVCLAIAVLAWIIFTAYTTIGKRSGLPGNLLVSTCVAIPFVYGSAVVTDAVQLNVLLFVSMVFLSNTGREITKGIVDVRGDKKQNVKTLAVRFGDKSAAIVASLFYVSATLLTPIPVLLGLVSVWFIPLVAITDFGLIASSFMLLNDHSRQSARRIKRLVLVWFIVGLVAFLIGTLR